MEEIKTSELIKEYKDLLLRCDKHKSKEVLSISDNLYDSFSMYYEEMREQGNVRMQSYVCQVIDEVILPYIDSTISVCEDKKLLEQIINLRKLYFALSARRCLKNFALYVEQYKHKKVWDKTLGTVESVFYYLDRFASSDKMNLFRASLMPSMGKSYIANLFVAQSIGNDPNVQILRITYADDLCITTTNQTRAIIDSRAFREIFPRYAQISSRNLFKTATKYQLCICDSEDEYNLFAVTRDGQSTGKRASILIIDDLLKDESESYNTALHKRMLDRYESTWSSRADDDRQKTLLLGTMWANTDLLNVLYDRYKNEDELLPSDKFKYCEITRNGSAVFIGIPAMNEKGESTCPRRYSTESLQKKKKYMSKFLWQCVYQQDPIASEGLEFDISLLRTYSVLPPREKVSSVRASLDPARKGKNYVSMPIIYTIEGKNYLVDCLYKKKSMRELYDYIVDKIIEHGVTAMVLENNIDTSLKLVLENRMHDRGYYNCIIEEEYSYIKKEQRIKDNQGDIRNEIVYPVKELWVDGNDMATFMEHLTSYSFEYPNKFDDSIDSIVLYLTKYHEHMSLTQRVRPRALDLKKLGF